MTAAIRRNRARTKGTEQTVHESVVLKQVEEWLTLRHIWHMRCNGQGSERSVHAVFHL